MIFGVYIDYSTLDCMEQTRSRIAAVMDASVSIGLALLVAYLVLREPGTGLTREANGALLMIVLSGLFAGAYWLTERLYIFRALAFVAARLSWPERKQMALVYA